MDDGLRQWGAAIVISVLVHGTVLYQASVKQGREDGVQAREPVRLSFRSVASPAIPATRTAETPVPVPDKPKPPKPKPPEPPKPEPKPPEPERPEPKPPEPKPEATERVETVLPPPQETPPEPQPEPTEASAPVTSDEAAEAVAELAQAAALAKARQRYEQELMAHIERHKFYPPIARRRGMEGRVQVSLTVLEAGDVSGLNCSSGPTLLQNAACNAVSAALPLPTPPEGLTLPLSVTFGMDFNLKAIR